MKIMPPDSSVVPADCGPLTGTTPRAFLNELLAVYEDTGFGHLVPLDELSAGFDEILDEFGPVGGELLKIERRRLSIAEAVLDARRFPHLHRLHAIGRDVLRVDIPEDFQAWVPQLAQLQTVDPSRLLQLEHMLLALLADARPEHRLFGRLALFELLCIGLHIDNDRRAQLAKNHGLTDKLIEAEAPHLVEVLAERELWALEENADYRAAALALPSPIRVPALSMREIFDTYQAQIAEEMRFTWGTIGDIHQRRRRCLTIMRSLDPQEAALFERYTAPYREAPQPTYAQLLDERPVVLDGLTEDAIKQRTKRAKGRWQAMMADIKSAEDNGQELHFPSWEGVTLATILQTSLVEEDR